jgi:hypothetical protein
MLSFFKIKDNEIKDDASIIDKAIAWDKREKAKAKAATAATAAATAAADAAAAADSVAIDS